MRKTCRVCQIEKPLDDFFKKKSGRDGRERLCKACKQAEKQQRAAADPEKAQAQAHTYYERHKDNYKRLFREWDARNPEKRREISSRYRERNRKPVDARKKKAVTPASERLEGKYIPEPNSGCWLWEGAIQKNGYGSIGGGGKDGGVKRAHRVSYEAHKGPIPEGLEIDHLCRVRCCINPDHLEAVTSSVNCQRGTSPEKSKARFAAQTHCKHGHPLSGDNVVLKIADGCVRRKCRACMKVRSRIQYHGNLEASRKYQREYKRAQKAHRAP